MAEIMVALSSDDQTISVPLATVFGTGIARIEQTVTSEDPEIPNEITCTLTNGQQSKFYIRNGKDGYSPSITIEQGAEGYSITVTDEEGSHEYSIIVDSTLDAESANPIQNKAVAGAVTQLTSDITAEVTRATNAETAIRTEASQIYATKAALQSEESARSLADTSLSNDIDAETQRATQAEASIRLAIPNKTSQLTNDSGFLTSAPVSSVNGKSGAVTLSASDVGALPSSTVIPSKTSQLTNDSHFITASEAPVQSVNGQTGAVTIPTATTSASGLMSSQDKVNLDAVRGQIGDLKNAITEDRNLLEYTVTKSANVWNPGEQITDKVVNNATASLGELTDGSGYTTSGFIETKKDDVLRWDYNSRAVTEGELLARGTTVFRLAEYDANKNCLLVTMNWASLPYTVQNEETSYVRVSVATRTTNSIIFGDTSTSQIRYIAYKETRDFVRVAEIESDVSDLKTEVVELENDVILPSTIYAVDGQEINIYKENLVLPKRLRTMPYLHTKIEESIQDDFRTIWTPTATALRGENSNFELCYGNGETVKSFPIAYYIVPKDTGSSSINVLIIGDSKVQNGYVSYHFLHNFDDDNMSVTLLGTKYTWNTANRHEGYGSRTAKWFCTDSSSPFYNNGSFDFANYLSTNNIATPDFVFINLGTNDCASLSGNTDTFITEFITYITQMIDLIHSVSSDIHVIVGLCEGCATTLDNNASIFINWDLNRKISMLHKATIEAFDRRTSEKIWVCPMYMGMDLKNDYNMTEVPLSARDGDVNSGTGNGKTRMHITDRVHQNEVGYWKNADYMYAVVKYIVATS